MDHFKHTFYGVTIISLSLMVVEICIQSGNLFTDKVYGDRPKIRDPPIMRRLTTIKAIEHSIIEGNLTPSLTSKYYLCTEYSGRLGNNLFQFASMFGIAAVKNMSILISANDIISQYFQLNIQITIDKDKLCRSYKRIPDKKHCGFDASFLQISTNTSYMFGGYRQSWKYFIKSAALLRKMFVFKTNLQKEAQSQINNVLNKHKMRSRSEATLIGVHIRRGDLVKLNLTGWRPVASKEYLHKAVQYFISQNFSNPIFIACSNDIPWTKDNLPKDINVEFMVDNSPALDMAILASCDHTITTVGTYGWWSAWLANGQVTYYKWPAFENNQYRKKYSKNYMDFFYPGWVGL